VLFLRERGSLLKFGYRFKRQKELKYQLSCVQQVGAMHSRAILQEELRQFNAISVLVTNTLEWSEFKVKAKFTSFPLSAPSSYILKTLALSTFVLYLYGWPGHVWGVSVYIYIHHTYRVPKYLPYIGRINCTSKNWTSSEPICIGRSLL